MEELVQQVPQVTQVSLVEMVQLDPQVNFVDLFFMTE